MTVSRDLPALHQRHLSQTPQLSKFIHDGRTDVRIDDDAVSCKARKKQLNSRFPARITWRAAQTGANTIRAVCLGFGSLIVLLHESDFCSANCSGDRTENPEILCTFSAHRLSCRFSQRPCDQPTNTCDELSARPPSPSHVSTGGAAVY